MNYTANVSNATDAVVVTATPSNFNANITITGGTNLLVGPNTITVVVTVSDIYTSASQIYAVDVTRASMVINTTMGWNGVDNLAAFGKGSIGAGASNVLGQTFVVAADAPTLQRPNSWKKRCRKTRPMG